ncbi:gluconokinase [Agromyces sp. ZXT2-3]|uniref:gluconokinase n=1 Tax=Agromyces sp. ZXT2-3 TaxID=3461152 RepID=UPI004054C6F0
MTREPGPVVVMGVSASGKSTIGERLADRLGVPFVDADDVHPTANVEKMRAGIPLDDADRRPWLDRVGEVLAGSARPGIVVACSSLRRAYRDRILEAAPATRFVHLDLSREELAARAGARPDHFMPPTLLASQLATLELPAGDEPALVVDASAPIDEVVEAAAAWVAGGGDGEAGGRPRA